MNTTRPLTLFSVSVPHSALVVAALLALYFIWGSTYLAVRIAVETFPSFLMTGTRFLIAGGVLFMIARSRGTPAPTPRQWRNAFMVGTLLMGGGMGLVAFAEQSVASGLAALAVSAMPLWAALFSGLFGHWSTKQEWVGLIVGFMGVVLLNLEGGLRGSPVAALALVVASVAWAFGSMWSKRLELPKGLMASAAEMLAGGLGLLAAGVLTGQRMTEMPSTASLLATLYLIVFGSLIAYTTYMWLLANTRTSLATSYAYVNPVVAVLLGVGLGGETISALGLIAMPVILAGVALLALAKARSAGSNV